MLGDRDESGDWSVYILECSDETLYTGITTDIERRIAEHNGEFPGGARYTRTRQPVKLVYIEESESRSAATKREAEIKRFSRQKKLEMLADVEMS